jgi:hypothetical protein
MLPFTRGPAPVCAKRPIARRRDDATQGTSNAVQRLAEAMGITSYGEIVSVSKALSASQT